MSFRYNMPLDPTCITVREYHQSHNEDPMSEMCGCLDEIIEAWENKHRIICIRCQEFGTANIEVVN